jgi:hypothetical protein
MPNKDYKMEIDLIIAEIDESRRHLMEARQLLYSVAFKGHIATAEYHAQSALDALQIMQMEEK